MALRKTRRFLSKAESVGVGVFFPLHMFASSFIHSFSCFALPSFVLVCLSVTLFVCQSFSGLCSLDLIVCFEYSPCLLTCRGLLV